MVSRYLSTIRPLQQGSPSTFILNKTAIPKQIESYMRISDLIYSRQWRKNIAGLNGFFYI